jgi:hypothetical protein
VRALREPVEHLGAAARFWAAPRVEVAVPVHRHAVLFDAHVAHAERNAQLADGHSLRALDAVDNRQPLRLSDLRDEFLVHVKIAPRVFFKNARPHHDLSSLPCTIPTKNYGRLRLREAGRPNQVREIIFLASKQ